MVLIPALNEEKSIPAVVRDLRRRGLNCIRVVDNGSIDGTAHRAQLAGAEVVREPRRGYGRACWTGLMTLPREVEFILFCAGDGSDDLSNIEALFAAMQHADLVLGNRSALPANRAVMAWAQRFGNTVATTLIRFGWGYRYADCGSLRLIRRDALICLALRDRGFGWNIEMQVRAIEERLRIKEIPVLYQRRHAGRSKISGNLVGAVSAGFVILQTLARLYFSPSRVSSI